MLLRIAVKELREFSRDHFTVCVLAMFIAILSISCIAFSVAWSRQFDHQLGLQHQAREDWLTQDSTSPHQATHNGATVYLLPSPLASFDPGVTSDVGTDVRLESHKRHEAENVKNAVQISLLQLDLTTPALLVQAVLPLVVIVLSHTMVSRERELGTWSLVTSFGISHQRFMCGKLAALFVLTVVLSGPVLVALLWSSYCSPVEIDVSHSEVFARAAALYMLNLLYLAGWCAAGTALSARYSSGTTLIVLLTCWAVWTLVIPRLGVDLAYSRFPFPTEQSLSEQRESAIRHGTDGQASLSEFNSALEKRLLREYKVTDLQDLPVNLDAARLLAMEEFTDAVDDNIQSKLGEIYRDQNRFLDWFELVSPYLAVRSVSASFAGTDRHHHAAFVDSAEQYRRLLVSTMNTAEMKGEKPGSSPASARAFWEQVPEFRTKLPPITNVISVMQRPILLLIGWFASMTLLALVSFKGARA